MKMHDSKETQTVLKTKYFIQLFRLKDSNNSIDGSYKRYVITNPPFNFSLLPTDQVLYYDNSIYHLIKYSGYGGA